MDLEADVMIRLKGEKKWMGSQRKAAVWGPSIGQEGLMNCCRVTVQSWWVLAHSMHSLSHPWSSDVFWKELKWKHCQDPCLPWGRSRNEVKAVFAMNHSQNMVYCRDIYESEGRMRSTHMNPPDLLTEVVQGRNQREKILHFCWKICQHPLKNSRFPLIITAKTQCF